MSEIAQQAEPPVPVSFKVTAFWKRTRNQHGLTSVTTRRLAASEALDWVLDCLDVNEDAVTVTEGALTTIVIDWTKVPREVRDPFAFGVRR